MNKTTRTVGLITPTVFNSPFRGLGIIKLGPPCCGKGTQAANLAKMFAFTHISSGAVLLGNAHAKPYMDKGKPVPDKYLFPALEEELQKYESGEIVGLIEDGWVRLDRQVKKAVRLGKKVGIKHFVAIEYAGIPKVELVRRMLERAARQGRSDDKPSVFEARIEIYNKNRPLITKALEAAGCPVRIVHGYAHPDTVFLNTIVALKDVLPRTL